MLTHIADSGNTRSFAAFLIKVCKNYPEKKVLMVLDNVPYHYARRLKPLLEHYKNRLELAFLPPYSPDLNPIERTWWWMRKKITHNRVVMSMEARIEAFKKLIDPHQNGSEDMKKLCNLIEIIY